eukprot:5268527-Alexandrium_andersonii.AAC.1
MERLRAGVALDGAPLHGGGSGLHGLAPPHTGVPPPVERADERRGVDGCGTPGDERQARCVGSPAAD